MTRYNYVCFKCRLARRAIRNIKPRCPICRKDLTYIGLCPIPKGSKMKAWSHLENLYKQQPQKKYEVPKGYVRGQPVVESLIDEIKEYENSSSKAGKRRYKKAKQHMHRIFHGDLNS